MARSLGLHGIADIVGLLLFSFFDNDILNLVLDILLVR